MLVGPARAQAATPTEADKLFEEGRTLLNKGKIDEACEKFAGSIRIEPSVGALVNLARCHETQGKTATAYGEYQRAATLADSEGQADRAKAARGLAAKLEKKLSRLTVRTKKWIDGMTIQRDDTSLGADALGVPLPVDPGEHTVVARAPKHKKWQTSVEVGGNADKQSVEIPELEPGADEPAAGEMTSEEGGSGAGAAGTTAGGADGAADEGEGFWNAQRWAGLGVGVVGVAGLVVGAVFGSKASSQWDEALTYCQDGDTARCGPDAGPLSEDAYTSGTVSTVAFAVGGAALAGGLIIFLTAPSGDDEEAAPVAGEPAEPASEAETALRLRLTGAPMLGAAGFVLEGRFR